METDTKTKQSIEEIARQLLTYKVKGKGNISHIINKPDLLDEGIQYLIDNKYITEIKGSNPGEYDVTPEGFEHVHSAGKELHTKL